MKSLAIFIRLQPQHLYCKKPTQVFDIRSVIDPNQLLASRLTSWSLIRQEVGSDHNNEDFVNLHQAKRASITTSLNKSAPYFWPFISEVSRKRFFGKQVNYQQIRLQHLNCTLSAAILGGWSNILLVLHCSLFEIMDCCSGTYNISTVFHQQRYLVVDLGGYSECDDPSFGIEHAPMLYSPMLDFVSCSPAELKNGLMKND